MNTTIAGGLLFPAIGLGTMRQQGEACTTIVEGALAEGYRHIDTARKYGNEREVGVGMARSSVPRDEILLTTKLAPDELLPDQVRLATEDSLRELGVDHVDLLLVHWPNPQVPLADTLGAMAALREDGLVRALGVANFPSVTLAEAAGIVELATDQVEYHPYLGQQPVVDACRQHGLVLTAYCPLARAGELLDEEIVRQVARDHARSPAQVVLRWLVQQPAVVAIPGASSVEHARENLAVEDFELSEEAMTALAGLERAGLLVDPPHAPTWDRPIGSP
jgi:2,5-diketo-D-gluconate reductase B